MFADVFGHTDPALYFRKAVLAVAVTMVFGGNQCFTFVIVVGVVLLQPQVFFLLFVGFDVGHFLIDCGGGRGGKYKLINKES